MLSDVYSVKLQGANFTSITELPIMNPDDDKYTKISLVYGRNGSGKSTIAKAIRSIAGESIPLIHTSSFYSHEGNPVVLMEEERNRIFVFDEDYVTSNVRIEGEGLESIVMLGEQADLSEKIKVAKTEFEKATDVFNASAAILEEYQSNKNPKSPKYYIDRIKNTLSMGTDCWADRERRVRGMRRNPSVGDETYLKFANTPPVLSRDELILKFIEKEKELESTKNGSSVITAGIQLIPDCYYSFSVADGNELIKKKIEHPELSERDSYLLELATSQGESFLQHIAVLRSPNTVYCPYCLQRLTPEYKEELLARIKRILEEEAKQRRDQLESFKIPELIIDFTPFATLASYQECERFLLSINEAIRKNNNLLQKCIEDLYNPILNEGLIDLRNLLSSLASAMASLEKEKADYNRVAEMTQPIVDELLSINDQIAYYDIVGLSKQLDIQKKEMNSAKIKYDSAEAEMRHKKEILDDLEGKLKRVDIAIDIINNGLKYIFFSENRLTIKRDGDRYKLVSNGNPVEPKNVSVGERNAIGLCYFFASVLEGKRKDTAYNEECLIVVDDPVSSFDFENRVGILSFLRYKLSQFLLGNANTRVIVMTHDLLTMYDLEKIAKELNREWSFPGIKTKYGLHELKMCELKQFSYSGRQEYSELLTIIFNYGCGIKSDNEIVIGNVMRQAMEAFATFEYKRGIDTISTDNSILDSSKMSSEQKAYFKNLMYRLVLNGGSHKEEQIRSLKLDFLSVISDAEKQRTAKDILCFIYLLNKQHLIAHLGDVSAKLDRWSEEIKQRAVTP